MKSQENAPQNIILANEPKGCLLLKKSRSPESYEITCQEHVQLFFRFSFPTQHSFPPDYHVLHSVA